MQANIQKKNFQEDEAFFLVCTFSTKNQRGGYHSIQDLKIEIQKVIVNKFYKNFEKKFFFSY